jgi:hypothetical protein
VKERHQSYVAFECGLLAHERKPFDEIPGSIQISRSVPGHHDAVPEDDCEIETEAAQEDPPVKMPIADPALQACQVHGCRK